jgi:hypothetical protein
MVPETPPRKTCWTGTRVRSSLPEHQINPSQLISFVSGSGVHLLSGARGALSGDVWIWRRGEVRAGGCGGRA